jgi:hypothetical protein
MPEIIQTSSQVKLNEEVTRFITSNIKVEENNLAPLIRHREMLREKASNLEMFNN